MFERLSRSVLRLPHQGRIPWIGAVLFPVLLSACQLRPGKTVDGKDDSAFMPGARISLSLLGPPAQGSLKTLSEDPETELDRWYTTPASDGDGEAAGETGTDEFHVDAAIEVEYTNARGEFANTLAVGEEFDLEGGEILGPGSIDSDFGLDLLSMGLRGGLSRGGWVGIDGRAGLSVHAAELELRKRGTAERATDDYYMGGPYLGAGLWVKPGVQWCRLYTRATGHLGFDVLQTGTTALGEVGVELTPAPGLSFFGGWRWMNHALDRDSSNGRSDIEIDLSGPVAGVALSL